MLLPMTEKQSKIFDTLIKFLDENNYPPTITEIQEILDIANPGAVYKSLSALEDKGYIEKIKRKKRGIRLSSEAKRIFEQ